VSAKEPFQRAGHSYSGTGANLPGNLHISVAPLRVGRVRYRCQRKEPLHALQGQISGFVAVLSPSHGLFLGEKGIIKLFDRLISGLLSKGYGGWIL